MNRSAGAAFAVFIVASLAYLPTLCPTIYVGDSGELATAAATLGIAHPPGYPLWTLAGRVATALHPENPAYALNVMSALCAAGAAGLLALLLHGLTGRLWVSAGVALGFAMSRGVWSQAVVTEVYALNLLMTSGALTAAFAGRNGRPKLFLLAAYLLGLGTANHPFVLLAGLPVAVLALLPSEEPIEEAGRRIRRLVPMAGLFVLGLTAYLYLPVRWSAGPEMNWGGIRSVSEIVDHVFRTQYGGLGEAAAETSYGQRLRVFFQLLSHSVPPLLLVAGGFGLLQLLRSSQRGRAAVLGVFFLLAGPLVAAVIRYEDTFLDHTVVAVFFLPAVMAAFLFAGVGLAEVDRAVNARLRDVPRVAYLFTGLLAVLIPGVLRQSNLASCDRSESTMAELYAGTIFEQLPVDSRLYTMGDNACFILLYFHEVVGLRPDIVLADRTLNLLIESYGRDFPAQSRVVRKQNQVGREVEMAFGEPDRPVFYTEMIDLARFRGCRLEPNGIVYQLLRPGEVPLSLAHDPLELPPSDPDDFLDAHLAAATMHREGHYFTRVGRLPDARASFREGAVRGRKIAGILRNLGLGHLDLGDMADAEDLFLQAIALEPKNEDALYNLAVLYSVISQQASTPEAETTALEKSLHYFERLVTGGTEFPEVFLNYGIQLVRVGRLAEAQKQAERALALEPQLGSAADLIAAARRGLEIGGEAGVLEARRNIEPITVGGTLQLAQRYLERGDFEKATELYQEAAQTAPESVEAAYGLGYGLLQAEKFEGAAQAFRRILAVDPDNADGRNALAYIFAQLGDSLASAQTFAEEALKLDPSRAAYWNDTLGWVLYRRGRYEPSLAALRQAEELLPPDDISSRAENDYHIGTVLMEIGQPEEARGYLTRSASRASDEFWIPDLRARARRLGLEEVY